MPLRSRERNKIESYKKRIILIVIVCAFLFYGIFDAIRLGTNDTDAIKFKFEEFLFKLDFVVFLIIRKNILI